MRSETKAELSSFTTLLLFFFLYVRNSKSGISNCEFTKLKTKIISKSQIANQSQPKMSFCFFLNFVFVESQFASSLFIVSIRDCPKRAFRFFLVSLSLSTFHLAEQ